MITSTPAKPARIAIQRPASSFSPRSEALASAIMIGTEKKIDEVTVSCRYCSAQKLIPVIAMNISARSACQRRWRVLINEMPFTGKSTIPAKITWVTKAQPHHHDHGHARDQPLRAAVEQREEEIGERDEADADEAVARAVGLEQG